MKKEETYGDIKKFVAFDVKIDGMWLSVPNAHDVCKKLYIDFVDYKFIASNIEDINQIRDLPSAQARKNRILSNPIREGVVLRSLIELTKNNGDRIMCKHKNDQFRETKTPRIVSDAELKILKDADKIADEWVTAERLNHVLSKLECNTTLKNMKYIINDMIDDVYREGSGELIESKQVKKAIAVKTVKLFKNYKKE